MPQHTTYGVGGFDPAKPNSNAIEQWDDDTRTYARFTAPTSTRPYTTAENAAADARTAVERDTSNGNTIRTQAANALGGNKAFLAIASPTNAQNAAQVKALTRQMNGLIRLTLGRLDAAD